ncbi:MAG: PAS domain-containing protein [Syntrophobacteraceae bacterium]|jgi:PAS domain S-box-containing protein
MQDEVKTKEQLIIELKALSQRVAESEKDNEERKRMEEELRESKQMLHLVLDTVPVRVFWKDHSLNYLGCNRPFALDAGLQSSEQIVGRSDFEMAWGEQAQLYRSDDRMVMETGRPKLGYEEPQTAPSGDRIWLRTSKVPLFDAKGEIKGVLGTYEDITVHKRAEEALQKAHHELERRVEERTAELEKANQELRQVPSKLISVQEEERKRLASELHDSIGQTLAAVKFWVEMALKLRDAGDGQAALNHLEQFVPTLQRSIEETRNIYMGLRPSMLDNVGLLSTLEWLRQECMKLYPDRHVELETGVAEEEIPESLKINIFRIAQEALNNVAKHSKAEWVDISLSKNGGEIELVVSDDGVGFDLDLMLQTSTARSLGLTVMRERAELTGGSFSIDSTLGGGTTIRTCWRVGG